MYEARYGDAWMFEVAEKYTAFCKEKGLHPVSTAIAWVGTHPAVTAPIIGASKLSHIDDAVVALDIHPDIEDKKALEELYKPHRVLGFT